MHGEDYHIPVLLTEAIRSLEIAPGGIYVDTTLGGGGYSEEILSHLPDGKLYSFDTDPQAIEYATKRLAHFGERFTIVKENFRDLDTALAAHGVSQINGIVYDLGVSSRQLDSSSVGLSYRIESELDMRLDPRLTRSAKEIIAEEDESELKRIFRQYGEEPLSGRIARWIVEERNSGSIETTVHLARTATKGIREDKKNSVLARIFQALRIEVNGELASLEHSLASAMKMMSSGGRIVAVSYHSLEDRIVKDFFNRYAKPLSEEGSMKSLKSVIDEDRAELRLVTRKPITPSDEEVRRNPRSRSAKMRVAEKR